MKIRALLICILSLSACSTLKKAVHAVGVATGDEELQKAESKLSPSQQYYFGRTLSANFFAQSPYISDASVTEFVNLVGQYLAQHGDGLADLKNKPAGAGPFKGFHFAIINNETPMAMSAPGGFVFVSSGMIAQLKTEDQLAGVLAHEIGHVSFEHGLDEVENEALQKGGMKLAKLAGIGGGDDPAAKAAATEGFAKVIDSSLTLFASQPHSRKQETMADRYSVKLMNRAGYFPADYLDLLETVKTGGFATKHPPGEDRMAAVQQEMVKLKPVDTRASRKTRFEKFKAAVARSAGPAVRSPASQ